MNNKKLVPSRFNAVSQTDDGGLMVYNSYSGAIISFSAEEKPFVQAALRKEEVAAEHSDIITAMEEAGFLVPDGTDEKMRAQFFHQSMHRTDVMHLVVMPTEACNFRCTYCYQTFPRGNMPPEIIGGLSKFISEKARSLRHLHISWFGGEPLLAPDVIGELSESFLADARNHNIEYTAEISTNGYFLTPELFKKLLNWQINRFMVTVDGTEEMHDARRVLSGGGKTFERIMENLRGIKELDAEFEIYLRINFDNDSLDGMDEFISFLQQNFGGDSRFQTFFRPVGRWGGKNDDQLPVCDHNVAQDMIWQLSEQGIKQGLKMSSMVENSMMPGGSVCYAAKPHSLVIGSDGRLYKCTVAFDEEFNHIGRLYPDGTTDIDYDKVAIWVTSGEEKDSVCQSCFYRPSCQGNHCPLYRFRTGKRPCPHEKQKIKKVLNLIWKNYNEEWR